MEVLLFIFLATLLWSGSPDRGAFDFVLIPVFIVCAVVIASVFALITCAATLVAGVTGSDALGVLTWCALLLGALFLNRFLADRSDRRRAAGAQQRS